MADVSITIGAKDEASPTIKRVADNVGEIEKKSGGAAKALGDVAKIASGFVVAQGLMKLPGLLSGFVSGASDLNESLSKVNTVFGSNAKEIESWASTAAKNLGMSKGAALEAAGTFGNFLQAMGATTPAATAMSKSMVELATDLGSFNNADPTEVLLALRSGLSGEAEPLRKFGVALSEAAVKAKALELGIGTVGKELTEQEKIQARYAIIMEQTTMAQGDFERTSGGLANQTKILKASFKDAADQLGTAMLPAVVAVMGALIQLLPFVISVGEAFGGKLMAGIKAVGGAIGGFIGDVKWLIENGGGLMDIVAGDNEPTFWQKLAFAVSQVLPALKEIAGMTWEALTDLAKLTWDGLGILAGWLRDIAKITIAHIAPEFERLKAAIAGISMADLNTGFETLRQKLEPAIALLKPLAERILVALKEQFVELKAALAPLIEELKKWEPVLVPLGKLLGTVLVVAIAALLLALEGFVRFTTTTMVAALTGITAGLTVVRETFEFLEPIVVRVAENVNSAVQSIVDKVQDAAGWIGHYLNLAGGYFNDFMNLALGPIQAVINKIQDLINKIQSIPSPGSIVGGLGGAIGGLGSSILPSQMGGSGALRNSAAVQQAQQDFTDISPNFNVGGQWINGVFYPSADTGSGSAQHATITIVQNIGSVGSKGEAAMMMQDGAYALATRGL
jgi:hypothetical protein